MKLYLQHLALGNRRLFFKKMCTFFTHILLIGCSTPSIKRTTILPVDKNPHASTMQSPPLHTASIRTGNEIVVCGRLFYAGTRVVLWDEPLGMNAYTGSGIIYDPSLKFPNPRIPPFSKRIINSDDIESLKKLINLFVIHYDAAGWSRRCFTILEQRALSVHFLLDLDGTIYQTMDLAECAWHATKANVRSIGIEMANIGAYPIKELHILRQWYVLDPTGMVRIVCPPNYGRFEFYNKNYIPRPARSNLIKGFIHGKEFLQYDFTEAQYEALAKLTATLCRIFPRLKCNWPVDAYGNGITTILAEDFLKSYSGLIGHYHIQDNKIDPGPAFQWQRVINQVRGYLKEFSL